MVQLIRPFTGSCGWKNLWEYNFQNVSQRHFFQKKLYNVPLLKIPSGDKKKQKIFFYEEYLKDFRQGTHISVPMKLNCSFEFLARHGRKQKNICKSGTEKKLATFELKCPQVFTFKLCRNILSIPIFYVIFLFWFLITKKKSLYKCLNLSLIISFHY